MADTIEERFQKLKQNLMSASHNSLTVLQWWPEFDELIMAALREQDAESRKAQQVADSFALDGCPGFCDDRGHWCLELAEAQKAILNEEARELIETLQAAYLEQIRKEQRHACAEAAQNAILRPRVYTKYASLTAREYALEAHEACMNAEVSE